MYNMLVLLIVHEIQKITVYLICPLPPGRHHLPTGRAADIDDVMAPPMSVATSDMPMAHQGSRRPPRTTSLPVRSLPVRIFRLDKIQQEGRHAVVIQRFARTVPSVVCSGAGNPLHHTEPWSPEPGSSVRVPVQTPRNNGDSDPWPVTRRIGT